jgi:cytochrome P450
MRFARLELALALATMVSRADLAVETAGPLSFAPSLSLRPETDVEAVVRRVRPDGRADWTGRGA